MTFSYNKNSEVLSLTCHYVFLEWLRHSSTLLNVSLLSDECFVVGKIIIFANNVFCREFISGNTIIYQLALFDILHFVAV